MQIFNMLELAMNDRFVHSYHLRFARNPTTIAMRIVQYYPCKYLQLSWIGNIEIASRTSKAHASKCETESLWYSEWDGRNWAAEAHTTAVEAGDSPGETEVICNRLRSLVLIARKLPLMDHWIFNDWKSKGWNFQPLLCSNWAISSCDSFRELSLIVSARLFGLSQRTIQISICAH